MPTKGPDLSEVDLYLFNEGSHTRLYEKLGCHTNAHGATFRVWAPNAEYVSVVGDFNGWDPGTLSMRQLRSGWWELEIDIAPGNYQYAYIIDGKWTPPPEAKHTIDDGYGGSNGLFVVPAR